MYFQRLITVKIEKKLFLTANTSLRIKISSLIRLRRRSAFSLEG